MMQLCKSCRGSCLSKHKFVCFRELIHKRQQLAPRGWACHEVVTKNSYVRPAAPMIAVPMQSLLHRDVVVSVEARCSGIMRPGRFSVRASKVSVVEFQERALGESRLRLHRTAGYRQTQVPKTPLRTSLQPDKAKHFQTLAHEASACPAVSKF